MNATTGSRHLLLLAVLLLAAPPVRASTSQETLAPSDSAQIQTLLFDGDLYLEEGDLNGALRRFQQAYLVDPEYLEARLALARALTVAVLEDRAADEAAFTREALRHFEWVLQRDPDNREAQWGVRALAQRFGTRDTPPLTTEGGRAAWNEGARAMEEERYEDAVRAFRAVVLAEPDVPGVHRALADALYASGRTDAAGTTYRKALALSEHDYRAMVGLGRIAEDGGRTEEALDLYAAALDLDERYLPAAQGVIRILGKADLGSLDAARLGLLGRSHLVTRGYEEARDALRPAVEADPSPENHKALGVTYFFLERNGDALAELLAAYEGLPEDTEVAYYLGAIYLRLGRREAGHVYLRSVLETNPRNRNALQLLGVSLADVPGAEEESLILLAGAEAEGAHIEDLPCMRGMLYMRLQRPDDAERQFQECLAVRPDFPPAHLGLGILADDRGDDPRAIEHLEAYRDQEGDQPGVLIRLGVSYLRTGHEEEGLAALERIVELDPTFGPRDGSEPGEAHLLEMASFFLGTVRAHQDAIWVGERLLDLEPDNAVYNNNLAMAYADADENPNRAWRLAERANELDPDNPGHMDTLGWALIRMEKYDEADAVLRRTLELAEAAGRDDLSEVYYHVGILKQRQGKDEEAAEWFGRALENPPTPWLEAEIHRLLGDTETP